jgi:ribosome-associated translation inhibitor RaiA
MRIAMLTSEVDLGGAVESYVERRLRFALGRFGARVGELSVRLKADGRSSFSCGISAAIVPAGRVTVEEWDPALFSAIDRATGRIGRLFAHELERIHDARLGRESVRMPAA